MSTLRNRIGLIAVATATISAGAVVAASTPAQAEEACYANKICIYAGGTGHDGGAYNTELGYRAPGVGLANISAGNRNRLSSWKNRSNTGARFYYSLNGSGTCVSMRAFAQASASASNPDDNQAESHAYTRSC
ncbi:peptidase inhibitor family I36 protein [Kribbella sp. NPDC056861]|uniref:peptidase inhibitor family I36 protein n=1 Tax=Kribbella sp. NPDC056861 TaxID=3154857 RepID=UPI00342CADB0